METRATYITSKGGIPVTVLERTAVSASIRFDDGNKLDVPVEKLSDLLPLPNGKEPAIEHQIEAQPPVARQDSDAPEKNPYECTVKGCSFKGKSKVSLSIHTVRSHSSRNWTSNVPRPDAHPPTLKSPSQRQKETVAGLKKQIAILDKELAFYKSGADSLLKVIEMLLKETDSLRLEGTTNLGETGKQNLG